MDRQAQGYECKLQQIFVAVGVLPILLVVAIILFSLMSDYFLSFNNIANVLRQSSYLTIVALGQMVVMVMPWLRSSAWSDSLSPWSANLLAQYGAM